MVRIFRLAKLSGEVDLLGNAWAVITIMGMTAFFSLIQNRKRESLHYVIGCGASRS